MPGRFKNRPAFAACIARGLKPAQAARAIGVTRKTVYRWKDSDPEFAAMWADALDERTEEAESQLFKAVQDGQPWAVMYALRHWCPEKYDRRVRVAVGGDASMPPIALTVEDVVHFYMPPNGRDRPEVIPDEQTAGSSITIEGEASEASESAA